MRLLAFLFTGVVMLYSQMPDLDESVCLVEALEEATGFFAEMPEEEIPLEFRFDSVWAEGNCDSADIYARIGPFPLKMMSAIRVDSCNLKMDYNPILEGIDSVGFNDTTVNVCEIEPITLTANSTEIMQMSADVHSLPDRVLFIYSISPMNNHQSIELQVFNSSGQEILSVSLSFSDGSGAGTYIWDRRGEDGKMILPGTYFAALKSIGLIRVIKIHLN